MQPCRLQYEHAAQIGCLDRCRREPMMPLARPILACCVPVTSCWLLNLTTGPGCVSKDSIRHGARALQLDVRDQPGLAAGRGACLTGCKPSSTAASGSPRPESSRGQPELRAPVAGALPADGGSGEDAAGALPRTPATRPNVITYTTHTHLSGAFASAAGRSATLLLRWASFPPALWT